MRNAVQIAAALALATSSVHAQPRRPPEPDMTIDAALRTQVIERTIAALHKSYVFPDVATKIEALLRERVAARRYDAFTSAIRFADQLTKDLQSVSRDKHLRMFYSAERVRDDPPAGAPMTDADHARSRAIAQQTNAAFVKVERLAGNIGYLRFDMFMSPAEFGPRIAAAMTFLADTDALILDLRHNHGGDPASVALMVSYLYGDAAEIHINDIYWRPDNSTRQFWTSPSLPGRRYPNKPVYALTSGITFSGGEECVYDLQALKRATLVGEITGGGANPGYRSKMADHFALFVPMGKAINPVTGTSWEAVGVKPDVATSAAAALDTAYRAALREQSKLAKDPVLRREIDEALGKLGR